MGVNINNLEIYYAGYWENVYGYLTLLLHEANHKSSNCAGLEELVLNSKYYIIILWSGTTTGEGLNIETKEQK